MAKLHFNYSAMNAGKSTLLLQASYNYQERGMRTLLFNTVLDDRTGKAGVIGSRIGLQAASIAFSSQDNLYDIVKKEQAIEPIACVFLDEAHFMTDDHAWQLTQIVDELNIAVMAYGLRTDFRGELFPGTRILLAIADELREVRTICKCGRKATMVIRYDGESNVIRDGAQIVVGGNETYASYCRRHWKEEMGKSG